MSKPKIYVHRMGDWYKTYMNDENEALLKSFAEVVSDGERKSSMSSSELIDRISGCEAILSLGGGGSHEITNHVLNAVGTVKLICIAHWCEQFKYVTKESGIKVIEGSNANTVAVAEWTLATALMGVRKLLGFNKSLKSRLLWEEPGCEVGMLSGSTVGLVGLGRIGLYCSKYFRTMGAKVFAYDKYWTKEQADKHGVVLVSLDDLLKNSDVVSLHLPVTLETKGMLRAREFALIKDDAIFINSARAALYDEKALIDELQKVRFTAFLDVFEEEPLPLDHPFRSMENVFITPHIAGKNSTMFLKCGYEAIETLKSYKDFR